MLTLFRNGGFPMFFVVGFGILSLAAAGWYAFRPNPRSIGFIVWMSAATFFSVLMGTATDLGAVFFHVSRMVENNIPGPPFSVVLLEGFAESMSPAIMGFAFLALTAFVTAVGKARER